MASTGDMGLTGAGNESSAQQGCRSVRQAHRGHRRAPWGRGPSSALKPGLRGWGVSRLASSKHRLPLGPWVVPAPSHRGAFIAHFPEEHTESQKPKCLPSPLWCPPPGFPESGGSALFHVKGGTEAIVTLLLSSSNLSHPAVPQDLSQLLQLPLYYQLPSPFPRALGLVSPV